jgi:hypothetical protein
MAYRHDLLGNKFNKLTVIDSEHDKNSKAWSGCVSVIVEAIK